MANIVGIDLGTTYSLVAQFDEMGRLTTVRDEEGNNLTPSCVASMDGEIVVGEEARRHWVEVPEEAVAYFKRRMGTSQRYSIGGQAFTPTQLSARVLKKLAAYTTARLGPIDHAVVTIPANFSHEARVATMKAAELAGLEVRYIINEPTAAALYYAYEQKISPGIYAIYDLGGGTFDISLVRVDGQDVEVLVSNGIHKLGGIDFDEILQAMVQETYKQQTGEDLESIDFTPLDAEVQKRSLSKRDKVVARVLRRAIPVTRSAFEERISSLIEQTALLCESTVEEAGVGVSDIQGVILAGGSTRMPIVQRTVQEVFRKEPISTVNVDEVVALGAVLYAAYKSEKTSLTVAQQRAVREVTFTEVTNRCFGTFALAYNESTGEVENENSIIIEKGTQIPCSETKSYCTTHPGQRAVACEVTECVNLETDPRYVRIIKEDELPLPPGRPAGQEIRVTFAYDVNQIMHCTFRDVEDGREVVIDLDMAKSGGSNDHNTD